MVNGMIYGIGFRTLDGTREVFMDVKGEHGGEHSPP